MNGIRVFFSIVTILACSVLSWAEDPTEDILHRLEHTKINRAIEETPEITRSAIGIKVFNMIARSVVIVATETSQGSGVIVSGSGLVVTNWHVVEDAEEYIGVAVLPKGHNIAEDDVFFTEIVKALPNKDLVILRMIDPPKGLLAATVAPFSSLQVGQDVHAIGHPEGLYWTYTPGVISQIRRNYKVEEFRGTLIQTQAAISFGSSGGALFNDFGQLVGITTFLMVPGLNFAVASDEVFRLLNR